MALSACVGSIAMECFPKCANCTGLCLRPVPPRKPTVARKPRTAPTAPKPTSGYIHLVCEHYTTNAEQTLLDVKPRKTRSGWKYWCEACAKWKYVKKTPIIAPVTPPTLFDGLEEVPF